MIDAYTVTVILIGLIGFGYGIAIITMLERCHYCNKVILMHKHTIRIPNTYGAYFLVYHHKCYKLEHGEIQIVP